MDSAAMDSGPAGTRTGRPRAVDGWHNATRRDDDNEHGFSEDLAQHHRRVHARRMETR